jgi:group I intron endonuclease
MFFIYLIENLLNGKLYIGKSFSPKKRFSKHLTISNNKEKYIKDYSVIHAAIAKYGKENFSFNIIKALNNEDEAYLEEEYLINYLKEMGVSIYNVTDGGKGVGSGTSHPMYGKTHTEKSITQMIASSHKGKDNHNYGKIFSSEIRSKMSKTKKDNQSARGEKNSQAKLNETQVREIKAILKEKILSLNKIAKQFNTSKRNILRIKQNKTWKHIT